MIARASSAVRDLALAAILIAAAGAAALVAIGGDVRFALAAVCVWCVAMTIAAVAPPIAPKPGTRTPNLVALPGGGASGPARAGAEARSP